MSNIFKHLPTAGSSCIDSSGNGSSSHRARLSPGALFVNAGVSSGLQGSVLAPRESDEATDQVKSLQMKVSSMEGTMKSFSDSLAHLAASSSAHYDVFREALQKAEEKDSESQLEKTSLSDQLEIECEKCISEVQHRTSRIEEQTKVALDEMKQEFNIALAEIRKDLCLDIHAQLVEVWNSLKLTQDVTKPLERQRLNLITIPEEVESETSSRLQKVEVATCEDCEQALEDSKQYLDQMRQLGSALDEQLDQTKELRVEHRVQQSDMPTQPLDVMDHSDQAQTSVRPSTLKTSCCGVALSASHHQGERDSSSQSEALALILRQLESAEHYTNAGGVGSDVKNEIASLTERLQTLEVFCRDSIQGVVEHLNAALTGIGSSFDARLSKLEKEFCEVSRAGHAGSQLLSEVDRRMASVITRTGIMECGSTGQRLSSLESEVKNVTSLVGSYMNQVMSRSGKMNASGGLLAQTKDPSAATIEAKTDSKRLVSELLCPHRPAIGDAGIDLPVPHVDSPPSNRMSSAIMGKAASEMGIIAEDTNGFYEVGTLGSDHGTNCSLELTI